MRIVIVCLVARLRRDADFVGGRCFAPDKTLLARLVAILSAPWLPPLISLSVVVPCLLARRRRDADVIATRCLPPDVTLHAFLGENLRAADHAAEQRKWGESA